MRTLALMLGVVMGLAWSCGGPQVCSAQTCGGCCDAQGTCRMGDDPRACGPRGSVCSVCSEGQTCGGEASCVDAPVVPVGGGAQGGGGGSTGGGGGEVGGGAPTGGGGEVPLIPTTCATNSRWTLGTIGNGDMNPGLACQSCHLGQNFQEQNPDAGHAAPYFVYRFMGTVFPGMNEENLCNGHPVDATVEILELDGGVVTSMRVRYPSGNFYSVAMPGTVDRPYRARVLSGGRVRNMRAAQTNGDCNSCHTEQGRNGAPGRILHP